MQDWFIETEKNQLQHGFLVKQRLFAEQSEFQKVEVFETETYGKMLALDGFVMLTDGDEFVYHEMIAHVPVCFHKDPKKIVVIGGGDGGTVRELLKHDCVEEVILCEIDPLVIDVSRKYFPKVAGALDDKRVTVKVGDGIAYMKTLSSEVDVVIVDSTDPIGPGEGLFTGDFYRSAAKAIKPDGLIVAQSESPWDASPTIKRIYNNMKCGFKFVKPYTGSIPTYPRGLWSWSLASQSDIREADANIERFHNVASGLKYLTEGRMKTLFDLAPFHKINLGLE